MLYKRGVFYQSEQTTGWQREIHIKKSGKAGKAGKAGLMIALIAMALLPGCTSMGNLTARDVEITDEMLARLDIDAASIKSREQVMCGTGRPGSGRAIFTQCLAVITSEKIECLTWSKRHPENLSILMQAPFNRFDTVELVKYGNGTSLRQVILRNAEKMLVMSYNRNEVDMAENAYKLLTKAGIATGSGGKAVYAEVNPDGIAPIFFPLQ